MSDINKVNNVVNIDLECYKELFKDEETVLYAPYYLSINYDLKKKFKNLKDSKLKSIAKKNKKQDVKEIYNYIKNEFLLKYIINKVIHLQPDNYVKFFDNNEIKQTKSEGKDFSKIKGLKLIKKNKKKSDDDLNFISINFNLNAKNDINSNENKEENKIKQNEIENNNQSDINMDNNNIINLNKTEEKMPDNINQVITEKNNNENNKIQIKEDKIKINQIKLSIKDNQNNNIRSNSNNSRNKSTHKKKQKKENKLFLFDTVKPKPKNSIKSKSPNKPKKPSNIPTSLNIKILKINNGENNNLSFFEKLHNSILKNEKKVNMTLQYLTKYKNYCIEEIKQIINKTYQKNFINYYIDLYGSYMTDLMIEASDIDIKIKLLNIKKAQFTDYFTILYENLIAQKKYEKIIPISTASVPVIKLIVDISKLVEKKEELKTEFNELKQMNLFKNYIFDKSELSQIRVDITFIMSNKNKTLEENEIANKEMRNKIENDKMENNNEENNEKTNVVYIKEQLDIYPEIKPILILLKRYFYVKNMNSSFEGGLSSYNLFLLILSFAKYNNFSKNKLINLGYFLIQFLEFFGKIFDFKNFTVNVNSPYIYEANSFNNYNSGKSLTILDPLTGLNASKSSYKIFEIQNMFLNAYIFFEKEKINYDNEIYKKENNDKRKNDKSQQFEGILGLSKMNKNEYSKKNNKDKNFINILDKFFFS